jgi:protein phosphatase PTC7
MLTLRAGRGELQGGTEGGWSEEIQKDTRRWGAGEDFFALVEGCGYVSSPSNSLTQTHLAVSDGVGGWAPQYDPSLFSQSLMHRYATAATSNPSSPPWEVLRKAYEGVLSEDQVDAGSATAAGVSLAENGELRGVKWVDKRWS